VVVGSASPIGRAAIGRFCLEGADLLAVDPDAGALERLVSELTSQGCKVAGLVAPLTPDGAAGAAIRCAEMWDGVDVAFLTAAALGSSSYQEDDEDGIEEWMAVFSTNLFGPIAYTQALLPLLKAAKSSTVVYLSSIDGLRGNMQIPAYSTSKGGLIPFARLMAQRYGTDGIRFNCIASGGINQTAEPVDLKSDTTLGKSLIDATPLRRLATPDDIASVAYFFASPDSAYVSGTVLPVDGGRIAPTPGTGGAMSAAG
jgi:NAD(P)-dependent dehydrogenase (short-subunit alcohol dehydrogenase family)